MPPRTARRYQKPVDTPEAALAEIGQWKVRYKLPTGGASAERAYVIEADAVPFAAASEDFRFATAVAAFGMLLRESDHLKRPDGTRRVDYPVVLEWARATARRDPGGYRGELLGLIQRAEELGAKQVALGR